MEYIGAIAIIAAVLLFVAWAVLAVAVPFVLYRVMRDVAVMRKLMEHHTRGH